MFLIFPSENKYFNLSFYSEEKRIFLPSSEKNETTKSKFLEIQMY